MEDLLIGTISVLMFACYFVRAKSQHVITPSPARFNNECMNRKISRSLGLK